MEKSCIKEKRQNPLRNKSTLLLLLLTVLWMAVIFYFSAQPADDSSQVSGFVKVLVDKALNVIFNGKVPAFVESILFSEHIVRKAGHFTEYFILGILTCLTSRRLFASGRFLAALITCVLYASSDEFHQIFVSGRGPAVTDVLLDSTAALAAISLVTLLSFLHARKKSVSRQASEPDRLSF